MPCTALITRSARKALPFFRNSRRFGSSPHPCPVPKPVHEPHVGNSSGQRLLLRFSELVKHFSNKIAPAPPSPGVGARPNNPHPFDYANLMKEFRQAGEADEVLRLFDEMNHFACRPDIVCYTTVVDTLVTAHRLQEALSVFFDMLSSGLPPDTPAYTVLVKMYACHLNHFDSAYEVIRWMVHCGCRPDVVTYATLITGLCSAGRVEEALGVLDQMLEEECCPNVHTFTPIVQAYCSSGRIREARRLLDTMDSIGCPPNTVTYNVLIEALCRIGSFDEVKKVLKESAAKSWKPDVITYSIYMDGLSKWGKADESFEQLEVMLENGLHPTTVTLNILLDCLCQASKVWEAKCLLERSAELEWDVDIVNYNTVMSRLCESGRYLYVLKLFTDILKKGIALNNRTFGIVIHSLCKAGKLRKAKCILHSRGIAANVVTYTTLIHHFCLAGKMEEAHLLFSEMVAKEIAPNEITYRIVIDTFCKKGKFSEAIDCFRSSLFYGFSRDLVGRLTYGLIRGGKHAEVLSLFEGMRKHDLILDVCIYHSLIKAFCRGGFCQSRQIDILCLLLDKMLHVG